MNLQRLSIHQTLGYIGIQTAPGQLSIESQPGKLSIEQPPADLNIKTPPGDLKINSDAAWSALGVGPNLEWSNNIYSQMPAIAMQGIAKIVEDGNRMADLSSHENAIADLAEEALSDTNPVEYTTAPAIDNVRVQYTPHSPIIEFTPHSPNIQYTPQKPQIDFRMGSVNVYVRQRQSIDIQVNPYNLYA